MLKPITGLYQLSTGTGILDDDRSRSEENIAQRTARNIGTSTIHPTSGRLLANGDAFQKFLVRQKSQRRLDLNGNTLANIFQNERLALILACEASKNWDGGHKPKEKDKKKDPSAFTGQDLFVELGTWYWTRISRVGNLWDDRVLRSGVPIGCSMGTPLDWIFRQRHIG